MSNLMKLYPQTINRILDRTYLHVTRRWIVIENYHDHNPSVKVIEDE